MARVHEVLVIPAYGYEYGIYDQGQSAGRFTDADLVDGYVERLVEELTAENIRVELLNTRGKNAVQDRLAAIEPHRLVLHCAAGQPMKPKAQANVSRVYHGPGAKDIATTVAEALTEWGQCYVWGHKSAKPEQGDDKLIGVPDTLGLRIEPFSVSGPNAEAYMVRLPQLGAAVGRAVAYWLRASKQALSRPWLAAP